MGHHSTRPVVEWHLADRVQLPRYRAGRMATPAAIDPDPMQMTSTSLWIGWSVVMQLPARSMGGFPAVPESDMETAATDSANGPPQPGTKRRTRSAGPTVW